MSAGEAPLIEVRFSAEAEVQRMTRDDLKAAIRRDEVGEDAVYRDEWSHPKWNPVFNLDMYRKRVRPESALAKKWAQEKADRAQKARETQREFWPKRFEAYLCRLFGMQLEDWGELGWDCQWASRLIVYPGMKTPEAFTCQARDDRVDVQLCRGDQVIEVNFERGSMPPPFNGSREELEGAVCGLAPTDRPVMDGGSHVHRFASDKLDLSVTWANASRTEDRAQWALISAYAEIARRAGVLGWAIVKPD